MNFFFAKNCHNKCLQYEGRCFNFNFYFHILNVTKYEVKYALWIVTTRATSQNWKKKNLNHWMELRFNKLNGCFFLWWIFFKMATSKMKKKRVYFFVNTWFLKIKIYQNFKNSFVEKNILFFAQLSVLGRTIGRFLKVWTDVGTF